MAESTTASASTPAGSGHLHRTLTLWPIVFFGLTYITPFIVLTTFGDLAAASSGQKRQDVAVHPNIAAHQSL